MNAVSAFLPKSDEKGAFKKNCVSVCLYGACDVKRAFVQVDADDEMPMKMHARAMILAHSSSLQCKTHNSFFLVGLFDIDNVSLWLLCSLFFFSFFLSKIINAYSSGALTVHLIKSRGLN